MEKRIRRFPDDLPETRTGVGRLRGVLVGLALVVALFAVYPVLHRQSQTDAAPGLARVTDCDRLAAHPSDPQRLAPGLPQEKVNVARGKRACLVALKRQPNDGRTLYQLGRMYFYDKDYPAALAAFRKSAAAGYPEGAFVLGLVLVQGNGTEPDTCGGGRLWLQAARQRHLYARIYLADNWRDGMFKDCGLDTADGELSAFLADSDDLVESDKARDDLAQAQHNWSR